MNELLETVEHETGANPAWTVLWLHGLGADGHDFAPIVPELLRPDWPALRFVFPHAVMRRVTINGGMRMRAWYDIADADLANRADMTGVNESVAQVKALAAREAERGVPAERLILAGFSQGGAVALTAATGGMPMAGVVALSTYLPGKPTALPTEVPRPPAFVAHGTFDPVVPLMGGDNAARTLRTDGFDVEWHTYPMAHQVCAEEINDLAAWLGQRFAQG